MVLRRYVDFLGRLVHLALIHGALIRDDLDENQACHDNENGNDG